MMTLRLTTRAALGSFPLDQPISRSRVEWTNWRRGQSHWVPFSRVPRARRPLRECLLPRIVAADPRSRAVAVFIYVRHRDVEPIDPRICAQSRVPRDRDRRRRAVVGERCTLETGEDDEGKKRTRRIARRAICLVGAPSPSCRCTVCHRRRCRSNLAEAVRSLPDRPLAHGAPVSLMSCR